MTKYDLINDGLQAIAKSSGYKYQPFDIPHDELAILIHEERYAEITARYMRQLSESGERLDAR